MMQKIRRYEQRAVVFLLLLIMIAGSLMAGCAGESKSYKSDSTRTVDGQTVVVEKEKVESSVRHDDSRGIFGGAFHLVGEILAFPFDVLAGLFRFIF